MKLSFVFIAATFWVSCGNDRIANDTSKSDPDIGTFQLRAEEAGIYGHWQRVEKPGTPGIEKFLTIDERVILHTTKCTKQEETTLATAIAKIELGAKGKMTVKSNNYSEAIGSESGQLCQSKIRQGIYWLEQPSGEHLVVKQKGLEAMNFKRVSRSKITGK